MRTATAKVLDICYITENSTVEGANDCILVGLNSYGGTVAVVVDTDSPMLSLLLSEIEDKQFVSVIMLKGEHISDKHEIARLSEQTGRNIEFALRGIEFLHYFDTDQAKVRVKLSRTGRRMVVKEPRFTTEALRSFYCVSCRNDGVGGEDCRRTVAEDAMDEVEVKDGRVMTLAECDVCQGIMTRAGRIYVKKQQHEGLAERNLSFEQPATAYCFSCKKESRLIWAKSVRYSNAQPRPSYRGNCASCLGMVGTPWTRTKMVPVKAQTREKLRDAVDKAQAALVEQRMEDAEGRYALEKVREAARIRNGMVELQRRFA